MNMRVKLEDVCERGSSNLRQTDVEGKTGAYPIYGAAGYIGNVDFYHQEKPYMEAMDLQYKHKKTGLQKRDGKSRISRQKR